jgi:hypothetical protein
MATYERLHSGTRVPRNAVIVTVRRSLGRTVADVAAEDQIADFPLPVPRALEQAANWCKQMGFARIQVIVDDEQLWNPEWGVLSNASSAGVS